MFELDITKMRYFGRLNFPLESVVPLAMFFLLCLPGPEEATIKERLGSMVNLVVNSVIRLVDGQ